MKWREFWIKENPYSQLACSPPIAIHDASLDKRFASLSHYHAIEKAAYDEAMEQAKKLRDHCHQLESNLYAQDYHELGPSQLLAELDRWLSEVEGGE